jgi:hypothetical protein
MAKIEEGKQFINGICDISDLFNKTNENKISRSKVPTKGTQMSSSACVIFEWLAFVGFEKYYLGSINAPR